MFPRTVDLIVLLFVSLKNNEEVLLNLDWIDQRNSAPIFVTIILKHIMGILIYNLLSYPLSSQSMIDKCTWFQKYSELAAAPLKSRGSLFEELGGNIKIV